MGAVAIWTTPAAQPLWSATGLEAPTGLSEWRNFYTALLAFEILLIPLGLWAAHQYSTDIVVGPLRAWLKSSLVVVGVVFAFVATVAILREVTIPRTVMMLNLAFLVAFIPGWRLLWVHHKRRLFSKGQGVRNVLIIGVDQAAQDLATRIVTEAAHGRRIVGFVSDDREQRLAYIPRQILDRADVISRPDGRMHGQTLAVSRANALREVVVEYVTRQPRHILARVAHPTPEELAPALHGLCVEEVFVSTSVGTEVLMNVVQTCRDRGVDVSLIPPQYPEIGAAPSPWTMGNLMLMGLYTDPVPRWGRMVKRAIDIGGSVFGMLLFAPILGMAALAIKIENPRAKVFYWGTRMGYKGRHFKICKFRTMVPDADLHRDALKQLNDREGPWFQIDEGKDPRITRMGRLLRKFTIDEIPQFWNVFRGDMSLVGPRPLAPDEVARFVDYDFRYYRSFDVKPGMTGLAQINSRNDPSFEKRIAFDFSYIDKWSPLLDLKLLVMTPFAILKQRGR